MKTNTVRFTIYGQHKSVEAITGRYTYDFETKQTATYTVVDGVAIITQLAPLYKTRLNIPLPLRVPVRDLGSGWLREVQYDADTKQVQVSICPNEQWAMRQLSRPVPTIAQELFADHFAQV